jgi:hypothetical protein
MQIYAYALPCKACGQLSKVRCTNCQQISCLDHLDKVMIGIVEIIGLCPECTALYASNPVCYGTLRMLGPWTSVEREQCMSA